MRLEEAASVPVTYGTAIHGMVDRGRLTTGMVSYQLHNLSLVMTPS
jgi:NADPH:quinone reductase-like Zn-dependent oxidoreductase